MNFPAKKVMQRYAFVASILMILGIAILGKALYIMTVQKSYWMAVSERFVKENQEVLPTRGNILAADGQVLAASLPEYKLFMDFMSWEKDSLRRAKDQHRRDSLLTHKIDSIAQGMHRLFPDIDSAAFRQHMLEGRQRKSHHWPVYPKRVTYIQYRQAKTLPLFKLSANRGGFHAEEIKTRKNPFGRLAIRTIGDLYKGKDSARTGIELSFDSILRGKPGNAHRQKVLNRYLTIVDKPAEDGCDVVTTLDVGMQDICEKALNDKLVEIGANSGVCILMEVATGDIKAMTSLTRVADGVYQEINADAVKNLYEPGSVFKPMSFLVGMDDGFIKMTDVVDVGCGIKEMYGRKMRDANWRSGGSGVVTVPQILQKSLNVGVSTLIDRYYHDNPQKFVAGIYRIGVNEDLKIPIPGYAKPRIRMPKEDGSNWSKTALPWMSIGYETQIPPITTVNFYNGIANNGKLLRPRLVKAIMKNGEVIKEYPVVVLRERMASAEAVKNIQECLESVVSVGLGKKAGSKYFHTSGKTGTAQVWTKAGFSSQYLVSFAGYFPSEKPLYSCIVCIQKGAPASGGGMCAPVFKRVAETVMAQRRLDDFSIARDTTHCLQPIAAAGNMGLTMQVLDALGISYGSNLQPDAAHVQWGVCSTQPSGLTLSPERPADKPHTVPDVKGYGLRDAVFRLERLGLRVKPVGIGTVTKQSLEPGHEFKKGDVIELTLGNPDDIPKAPLAPKLDVPLSRDSARHVAPADTQPEVDHEAQPAGHHVKPKPAQDPQPAKKTTEACKPAVTTEEKTKAKKAADTKKVADTKKTAAAKKDTGSKKPAEKSSARSKKSSARSKAT